MYDRLKRRITILIILLIFISLEGCLFYDQNKDDNQITLTMNHMEMEYKSNNYFNLVINISIENKYGDAFVISNNAFIVKTHDDNEYKSSGVYGRADELEKNSIQTIFVRWINIPINSKPDFIYYEFDILKSNKLYLDPEQIFGRNTSFSKDNLHNITFYTQDRPTSVAIKDLNNDGVNEIIVTAFNANVTIYTQNENNEYLQDNNQILYGGTSPYDLAIEDLNHDDLNDLAVINWNSDNISIFYQSKNNMVSQYPDVSIKTPNQPYNIVIEDLNNDDLNDIAIICGHPRYVDNTNEVNMYFQKKNNLFPSIPDITIKKCKGYITSGDFNNDDFNDIIIGPNIHFQKSDNNFTNNPDLILTSYGRVAVGDLNNDTLDDIILGNTTYYQKYDDSFSLMPDIIFPYFEQPPPTNYLMMYPLIADLNNDGLSDIIFSNYIHYQKFNNTFSIDYDMEINLFEGSKWENSFATGDLNNDGLLDIVMLIESKNSISIYYQEFDKDGDGYIDVYDRFPYDPLEWLDNDNDKVGDNGDTDDDNDGYPDNEDLYPLDESKWKLLERQNDESSLYPFITTLVIIILVVVISIIIYLLIIERRRNHSS